MDIAPSPIRHELATEVLLTNPSDRDYWDQYYSKKHVSIAGCTTFARFCADRLAPESALFELGCGNGRDALFFAELGHRVTACDQSSVAINNLQASIVERAFKHPPTLLVGAMGALPPASELDAVYSRFTLHAVTADEASRAMRWALANLMPGGRLFAEARSVLGSLYGKGEEVARDTFLHNDHTRRFLRRDELVAELTEIGFSIVECIEADGLAVHKDDDPVVIRVVARKAS